MPTWAEGPKKKKVLFTNPTFGIILMGPYEISTYISLLSALNIL